MNIGINIMNINEAKQIVENIFSPYDSEIEPNNEKTGTFDLVVFKDKSKSLTYGFSKLDISNMSKSRFRNLVKGKRKSLQEDYGFIFDKS